MRLRSMILIFDVCTMNERCTRINRLEGKPSSMVRKLMSDITVEPSVR